MAYRLITLVLWRALKVSGMLLTGCSKHQVGAWAIRYTLVKVRESCEIADSGEQDMPCSLSVNYEACHYRWITRVIWRALKVSGMLLPSVLITKSEYGRSSTLWLRLKGPGIAHCSKEDALFTFSQL